MEVQNYNFLSQQVDSARDSLGVALGQVQDIQNPALDVDVISRALASAVRSLFMAESEGMTDNRRIGEAMDHLRGVLQLMQNVATPDPSLDMAMATVARILAVLFPVCKALPDAAQCRVLKESRVPPPPPRSEAPAAPTDDRRETRRIQLEADIGFQSETNFFTGFSLDISSGGLFVATYSIPPIGTPVNLNFKLPSGPVMSVNGHVRWVRLHNLTTPDVTPGIGVHFESLSPEQQQSINAFLAKKAPMFYDDL